MTAPRPQHWRRSSTAARQTASWSGLRGSRRSFPPRDRRVVAPRGAGVKLPRPPDLLLRILDHFFPLGNPADRTRNRKQHGEHGGGEAHRLERDARIEVDVGIELLLDEIVVMQ